MLSVCVVVSLSDELAAWSMPPYGHGVHFIYSLDESKALLVAAKAYFFLFGFVFYSAPQLCYRQ